MTFSNFTWAEISKILERTFVVFVVTFLGALGSDAAGWTVSIAEKAAVAGVLAAAEFVRGLIWTWASGQPQITPAGRAGAKAAAN